MTGRQRLGGARAVAVAPDGRHVVVAGETANGVAVFARNLTTGVLTFVEAKLDGAGGVDGLGGASALAFSPAGDALYVAGFADNAVAAFSRDLTAAPGSLAALRAERETDGAGSPLVDGTAGARGVAVSPDGSLVFVAGATDGKIASLQPQHERCRDSHARLPRCRGARLGGRSGHDARRASRSTASAARPTLLGHVLGDASPRPPARVPAGSDLTFLETVAIPAQGSVTYTASAVLSNSASGTLVNTATVRRAGRRRYERPPTTARPTATRSAARPTSR